MYGIPANSCQKVGRKLRLFILLVVLFHQIPAEADETLLETLKGDFDFLEGTFIQFKHLDALPKPLRSEGHFKFDKQGQLSWFVMEPVKSHIEVYHDQILQFDGETLVMELPMGKYPFVRVLSSIFFGLLENDISSLSAHFVISSTKNEATWRKHLVPKNEGIGQVIEWIQLEGSEQLEQFTMQEKNGDKLQIEFHQLRFY